jgi:very-short-patch-repair endonuclease
MVRAGNLMRFPNENTLIRAKHLRKALTPAEETLWSHLRDRRFLGLKFRRQAPIGPYVADFLCHEMRLVLELDGSVHREPAQISHDQNRDANLRALGYRVLRYTNEQLQNDLDSILEAIRRLDHTRTAKP